MDIERLRNDPAYWDEVAPEGATHYNPGGPDGYWYDLSPGGVRLCWSERYKQWVDALGKDGFFASMIPRPIPQWRGPEDGLPPVGAEVEAWIGNRNVWAKVTVLAVDVDTVVWRNGTDRRSYVGTHFDDVRPLKSDKDRAVEAAMETVDPVGYVPWGEAIRNAFSRAYDAGLLKLPEGQS